LIIIDKITNNLFDKSNDKRNTICFVHFKAILCILYFIFNL